MGRTLTVTPGTFDPANSDVTYTWLRNGHPGRRRDRSELRRSARPTREADLGAGEAQPHRLPDRTITLDTDGVVTTVPDLAGRARPASPACRGDLRVSAPGVASPGGKATVKIGQQQVTGRVVDGRLKVVLDGLPAGKQTVKVSYDGHRGHARRPGEDHGADPAPLGPPRRSGYWPRDETLRDRRSSRCAWRPGPGSWSRCRPSAARPGRSR